MRDSKGVRARTFISLPTQLLHQKLDAYGAQRTLTRTARGSKRDLLVGSARASSLMAVGASGRLCLIVFVKDRIRGLESTGFGLRFRPGIVFRSHQQRRGVKSAKFLLTRATKQGSPRQPRNCC